MKIGASIVFATNNEHKLQEARALAGDRVRILSLAEIGCHDEIPETGATLEENSLQKAMWVKTRYGYDCFADDTGLFVEALDGRPGVRSARYAGEHCSPSDNIDLLLHELEGVTDRRAAFRTVVTLLRGDKTTVYEGRVEGRIADRRDGTGGFGYDPVFIADESGESFARMSGAAKNGISHRGRAMRLLFKDLY